MNIEKLQTENLRLRTEQSLLSARLQGVLDLIVLQVHHAQKKGEEGQLAFANLTLHEVNKVTQTYINALQVIADCNAKELG